MSRARWSATSSWGSRTSSSCSWLVVRWSSLALYLLKDGGADQGKSCSGGHVRHLSMDPNGSSSQPSCTHGSSYEETGSGQICCRRSDDLAPFFLREAASWRRRLPRMEFSCRPCSVCEERQGFISHERTFLQLGEHRPLETSC